MPGVQEDAGKGKRRGNVTTAAVLSVADHVLWINIGVQIQQIVL